MKSVNIYVTDERDIRLDETASKEDLLFVIDKLIREIDALRTSNRSWMEQAFDWLRPP